MASQLLCNALHRAVGKADKLGDAIDPDPLAQRLTLTDPNISALKPGTLMIHILDEDVSQIFNCWKCLTINAMTKLMQGYPKEALEDFQKAANVVERDTGSVPAWLASRLDIAAAEAAKQNH